MFVRCGELNAKRGARPFCVQFTTTPVVAAATGGEMADAPQSPLKSSGERLDEDENFFGPSSPGKEFNSANFFRAPMMDIDMGSPKVKGCAAARCLPIAAAPRAPRLPLLAHLADTLTRRGTNHVQAEAGGEHVGGRVRVGPEGRQSNQQPRLRAVHRGQEGWRQLVWGASAAGANLLRMRWRPQTTGLFNTHPRRCHHRGLLSSSVGLHGCRPVHRSEARRIERQVRGLLHRAMQRPSPPAF